MQNPRAKSEPTEVEQPLHGSEVMISMSDDNRNQPGLTALRTRYVVRARYLTNDRSGSFLAKLITAQKVWNLNYPEYAFSFANMGAKLSVPSSPWGNGLWSEDIFFPETLEKPSRDKSSNIQRRFVAKLAWRRIIMEPRKDFWDQRYFPNPLLEETNHPLDRLVSACLLFDPRTLTDDHIDNIIPKFTVFPFSIPYSLNDYVDPVEATRIRAEHDFLVTALHNILVDDSALFDSLILQTTEYGRVAAFTAYPNLLYVDDPNRRWWYVPIVPTMSANDFKAAATGVADRARELYGENSVEQMILDLAKEGMSQVNIANLIGVARSTVSKVLSKERRRYT